LTLAEPKFKLYDNSFAVIFYGSGENILDLVSNIPEDRKTDLNELSLNDRQIEALTKMIVKWFLRIHHIKKHFKYLKVQQQEILKSF
jgi:hypothetical protein